jgi:AcrR family transcriptional regulator
MAKAAGALQHKAGRSSEERGNKGERTRARVKTAFCELLARKSFAAITISDICLTGDITVGGFYFHFANQDALLNEVMWEYADELGLALDKAMEGAGSQLANTVCAALVSTYQEQNGLARSFQQLRRMRAEYAARWRTVMGPRIARLAVILRQERLELSSLKATFLAYALVTMALSQLDLAYVYVDRRQADERQAVLTGKLALLWRRMVDAESPTA